MLVVNISTDDAIQETDVWLLTSELELDTGTTAALGELITRSVTLPENDTVAMPRIVAFSAGISGDLELFARLDSWSTVHSTVLLLLIGVEVGKTDSHVVDTGLHLAGGKGVDEESDVHLGTFQGLILSDCDCRVPLADNAR